MSSKNYFGQNPLELKFREMEYSRHVSRVTEIVEGKRQPPASVANASIVKHKEQFNNAKSSNIRFNESLKQHSINTKNQDILCKLVEISQGRCCFLNSPDYMGVHSNPNEIHQKPAPLLHMPFRQEALRKIDLENKALAKRLFEQKSFINRDKLRKDINEYEKLKSHMQKHKSQASLLSKPPQKLPPLIKHKFSDPFLQTLDSSRVLNTLPEDMSTYRLQSDRQQYLQSSPRLLTDRSSMNRPKQLQDQYQNEDITKPQSRIVTESHNYIDSNRQAKSNHPSKHQPVQSNQSHDGKTHSHNTTAKLNQSDLIPPQNNEIIPIQPSNKSPQKQQQSNEEKQKEAEENKILTSGQKDEKNIQEQLDDPKNKNNRNSDHNGNQSEKSEFNHQGNNQELNNKTTSKEQINIQSNELSPEKKKEIAQGTQEQ